jgi:hypothetical protein
MVQFHDDPPVSTLPRADEKDGSLFQGENKKAQVRHAVQQEIFLTGRISNRTDVKKFSIRSARPPRQVAKIHFHTVA